jgi:hypothetical protein
VVRVVWFSEVPPKHRSLGNDQRHVWPHRPDWHSENRFDHNASLCLTLPAIEKNTDTIWLLVSCDGRRGRLFT